LPKEPKKTEKTKKVKSKHDYPGCIDLHSEQELIEKRLAEAMSEIEDVNEFPLVLYEETIQGVTLKHVVDNLFN